MNKKLLAGLSLLLLLALLALFSDVIAPYDPTEGNLADRLKPPSAAHLFGTDPLGRDTLSRVLHGARLSLRIAAEVLLISMGAGILLGFLAGYLGGIADAVVMTVVEILLAFPGMILALAIAGILGVGMENTVIAICAVSWIGYARMVRNLVMSIKEKEYVKYAVLCDTPTHRIALRHILPNLLTPTLSYAGTHVSSILMHLASLSFLGFGAQPPVAEWGAMLSEAKGYLTSAPWLSLAPAALLVIMVIGFNLLGEGIAETIHRKGAAVHE